MTTWSVREVPVSETPEGAWLRLEGRLRDPKAKRLLGNFPQAFSHVAIINTAAHLAEIETGAVKRGNSHQPTAGAAAGSAADLAEQKTPERR